MRTGHASAVHRGLGRAIGRGAVWRGSGLPCGQRAACESTGTAGSVAVVRVFALPPHSPADAGLFVGRRSATAAVHAPGLRWHTGGRGRVRLRHGASQPALRRSVRRCGLSRPRPRPPVCQRLQGYRAARCPHGIPSLARHTAPLPMALPYWGRALARPVRTVGGRDSCSHNAAGATRRPPPWDRVFGCGGAGYFTRRKPTLPSGVAA